MYAEVILPVPLPTVFSYRIPDGMELKPGMRVQVPLGKKTIYKGIVHQILSDQPAVKGIRDIQASLDQYPIVGEEQIQFWKWLAEYYMCTLGEVYRTAMPRGLKESYTPKYETFVRIAVPYCGEDALNEIMDILARAPKQLIILQRLVEILIEKDTFDQGIQKASLAASIEFSPSAYKGLLRKKILSEYSERAVRMPDEGRKLLPPRSLTPVQKTALTEIVGLFKKKQVVLLKGVTSSGKTEIYIRLIKEMLEKGKQVLYLLPEIALTTQIIERLKTVFGDKVGIYHSKYSDADRAETFLRSRQNPLGGEYGVILGARSAIFLPFRDLGLIIIDEEHEQTYKQWDPAPRYHARDAAIMLAEKYSATVLLGSATPSFESYHNARTDKFGLVELEQRFGDMMQPEIHLANLREAYRKKRMVSHFTPELYEIMKETLSEDRQVILFQNRRGFSPYIECFNCGWIPGCKDCDVSLVYHKQENRLVCHYCGYTEHLPGACPDCSENHMVTRGFGTEKLEEEVEILFPEWKIVRMDMDTTRSRRKYEKIIRDFESGNTQILIGTQIVTKGLDFDNVGLVGVLHADNILNFPDFRSFERSFQLISQVAGRSGRKDLRGRVIVQTSQPDHPVMQQVLKGDYHAAYLNQMEDRQGFHYPPYSRLLRITLKHADKNILDKAAADLVSRLRSGLIKAAKPDPGKPVQPGPGKPVSVDQDRQSSTQVPEVLGPQSPQVSKVQQMHLMTLLVKLPRTQEIGDYKNLIGREIEKTRSDKQYGKLFIIPDVDPY
ncbi:primosomal protein N' [Bacteroidota bacterium]